jgi:anti-sigma factor RsiW
MADLDRVIAGLSCRQVLDHLSDVIDGAIGPERLAQIRAHLAECHVCDRFGGQFAALVSAARRVLAETPLDPGAAARLRERLRRERG